MGLQIVRNRLALPPGAPLSDPVITRAAADAARSEIGAWPSYAVTPLRSLAPVATATRVASVLYKDEAERLGAGSFKALGGAYAVARYVQGRVREATGREVTTRELAGGAFRDITEKLTVICATDGNHGRSVAAGARLFGCQCIILLHAGVSATRELAIAREGAQVLRTPGDFDDAVAAAARTAAEQGWALMADTAGHGAGAAACLDVMAGYTVLASEALEQIADNGEQTPTHIFLQAGVGGLAAAVTWRLRTTLGASAPTVVVVEPKRADPLFQSARAGAPRRASGDLATIMACLSCGEVSDLAWAILKEGANFFMTISDDAAIAAMRLLADETRAGARIVAGESAGAGLAGFLTAAGDRRGRTVLGLAADSRVLVIGTEGATDPTAYEALVGHAAVTP